MTREKYAASERALTIFKSQFSMKNAMINRVTAFKNGLAQIPVQLNKQTTITPNIGAPMPALHGIAAQRTPKTEKGGYRP